MTTSINERRDEAKKYNILYNPFIPTDIIIKVPHSDSRGYDLMLAKDYKRADSSAMYNQYALPRTLKHDHIRIFVLEHGSRTCTASGLAYNLVDIKP